MWGICFDSKLFQCVVAYETCTDSTTVNIVYPVEGLLIAADKIRKLENPPQFFSGELVSPVNHPEIFGVIREIGWHFNNQDYMYFITVNGRKRSKRYYNKDLIKQ